MPAQSMNLTGHKYGMLTVLGIHDKVKNERRWKCVCSCGTECIKYGNNMRSGAVVSCGCEQKRKASVTAKKKAASLVGKVFSRLTVIEREGSNKFNKAQWRCRCECGNEILTLTGSLKSGNTTSCGCFQKEIVSEMFYNPEITDEERLVSRNRSSAYPKLYLWRKAVYKRDDHTCQACRSSESGSLVAHHKDGWNKFPDRRLDIDNGVTMCVSCHRLFHKQYGQGNNTEDQWNTFVDSKEVYYER